MAVVFDCLLEGNIWYVAHHFHELFHNPEQVTLLYVRDYLLI